MKAFTTVEVVGILVALTLAVDGEFVGELVGIFVRGALDGQTVGELFGIWDGETVRS